MTGNREVITGSDFKRMVAGAYSEFLLEYEEINRMSGAGTMPGTHVLRTIGAAVMALKDTKEDSIGGLSRGGNVIDYQNILSTEEILVDMVALICSVCKFVNMADMSLLTMAFNDDVVEPVHSSEPF